MTFTCNRKALLDELVLLQTVAEKKGTIPVLSYLLFQIENGALTITATDIDMSLTTRLNTSGESWAGCVPSKQLYELTRLLNEEDIEFQPKDNGRIQISRGKSRHLLLTIDVEHFPAIDSPNLTPQPVAGDKLRSAIERALVCVDTGQYADSKSWWAQGVALRSQEGKLCVAGTNSRHFALTEIQSDITADVIIPLRAAQALVKIIADGPVEVATDENHAVFRQGTRRFITRLLAAKFPDWRLFLPASFKHRVSLPDTAKLAFKLVAVTSEESALVPIPLTLTFSKDELLIETGETDKGCSTESIPIECATLNGEGLRGGANGLHFLNFLASDTKPVLSLNDVVNMYQLTYENDPDYRYITMALKA